MLDEFQVMKIVVISCYMVCGLAAIHCCAVTNAEVCYTPQRKKNKTLIVMDILKVFILKIMELTCQKIKQIIPSVITFWYKN